MQQNHYWMLLNGLGVTAELTVYVSVLATIFALLAGIGLAYGAAPIRWFSRTYVEIFRGTSLLVQLFWIYYVLPQLGIFLDPYIAGVLAISLNSGAYGGEAVRAALVGIPVGQTEASAALGLPRYLTITKIILPQAIAFLLPQWGNFLIEGMKATAVVSFISIHDLSFVGYQINGRTFDTLQVYGIVLILYFGLSQLLVIPARVLEKRLRSRQERRLGKQQTVMEPIT